MPLERYELIVVGAGPGGSAAALAALRERPSARVLLLDRAPPGRDKVCGDGIGPDAARELDALGAGDAVRPEERVGRFRLRGVRSELVAEVNLGGYVVPRAEFDARLLRHALRNGAEFRGHQVRRVRQEPAGVVVDDRYTAPVLVGADGANSVVRRCAGRSPHRGRHLAVAVRGYVPAPPGSGELRLHWDPRPGRGLAYAWAFPTVTGLLNVGYGAAGGGLSRAELVARATVLLPDLQIDAAALSGHLLPLSSRVPSLTAGPVLLVGDAAGLVNPLTGEGIFYALASGALAGRSALSAAPASGYAAAMRARFGAYLRQVRVLARLVDRPWAIEAVVRAGRDPRVFERLLAVATGERRLDARDLLRMALAPSAVRAQERGDRLGQ